jgi:hypothetical protein
LIVITLATAFAAGCRCHDSTERLSAYGSMSEPAELQTLADRSSKVKSVTGTGTLQLTRPNGESVVLDLIAVLAPPDRAHLRASKLGHTVFDLTETGDALYLQAGASPRETAAGTTAAQVTKGMGLITGKFFSDPAIVARDDGPTLMLTLKKPGEPPIFCEVDRRTLTARSFRMVNDHDQTVFTMTLGEYDTQNGVVWPRRVTAVSAAGTIVVLLDDIEINGELTPAAFVPSPGAMRLP